MATKDKTKPPISTKDKIWIIIAIVAILAAFVFVLVYGLDFLGI